jgi:hypothetical protein
VGFGLGAKDDAAREVDAQLRMRRSKPGQRLDQHIRRVVHELLHGTSVAQLIAVAGGESCLRAES